MTNHNGDFSGDEAITVAALGNENGRAPSQPHAQNDLLGVTGGGSMGSPLDKLIEGSDEFVEWAARGNRTQRERVAEVYLMAETEALINPQFAVRARMMKGLRKQAALLTLLSVPRPAMSKMEFWLLIAGMATILGVLFLITTMVTG